MPFATDYAIPRTDISTALMEAVGQEGLYIAPLVFPVYPSETEVGRYPRLTVAETELLKGAKASGGSTKRNPTGTYNESESRHIWDTYQTAEYGEERRVDDVIRSRMRNFFDADMIESKILMNRLMTDYEVDAAAALIAPGNPLTDSTKFLATAASGTGGDWTEGNILTFDFAQSVTAAIERLTLKGEQINLSLIMSLPVWNRVKRSTKLANYIYGPINSTVGGANLTEQSVASALGLSQIIIAKKAIDTAVKGLAASLSPVWGNTYVWVGSLAGGDFMNGGAGRTIIWNADSPGGIFTSEQYRAEERRGDMIRVRSNRVIKVVNNHAGELITTGYAN